MVKYENITVLTPEIEERIHTNPLLNIDTFIIPSPYIKDASAQKDDKHCFVWIEEGEILGYILTYASLDRSEYLIYKLVTSPYGRGRGIGTSFIEHLAEEIPEKSRIYLYVWEKQHETLEFFQNKGFDPEDNIVYRNLVYYRLAASREVILKKIVSDTRKAPAADEIGRTRHDARKVLSSLNAMVNALAPENAGRIIEDINRETTTLVNMLNMYRDSMAMAHEVNIQELILERLVPYIEACGAEVELIITLSAQKPIVLGHWLNISRALVNLASNSIDAMEGGEKPGQLSISLTDEGNGIVLLCIADNGHGIPEDLLIRDEKGVPAFIGKTTKTEGKGEGFGTVQVWSIFGPDRLEVKSQIGTGTTWTIRFERSTRGLTKRFSSLQRRFHELQGLAEEIEVNSESSNTDIVAAIWRLRKKEIFLFELLERFSRQHNIRDLFRVILSYWQKSIDKNEFDSRVSEWKGEHAALNTWLATIVHQIANRRAEFEKRINLVEYRDILLKSYGQSLDKVIIFTLNPSTGDFLATDRKLAEHLDFVGYLGGNRNSVLRGEFVGDMTINSNPIYLGVWSVDSDDDLLVKLKLLQDGARTIVDYGISPEKKLAFYQSTYARHSRDIDSDASSTLGEFIMFTQDELQRGFVRTSEDEMQGFLAALD